MKKIICGSRHLVAIVTNNEIYTWGYNYYSQLGLGHNQDQNSPQKLNLLNVKKIICGGSHSIAITTNNEIYTWGRNDCGQLGLGHNQNIPKKIEF